MDELARQCAAMMETMRADGMTDGGTGMMGMGGMGGMFLLGLLWLVIALALVALLVAGVVWIVRRRQPDGAPTPESARQTLDHRYASGELDRTIYLQMRADLEASS
jgi:uncharacterized membrane protein